MITPATTSKAMAQAVIIAWPAQLLIKLVIKLIASAKTLASIVPTRLIISPTTFMKAWPPLLKNVAKASLRAYIKALTFPTRFVRAVMKLAVKAFVLGFTQSKKLEKAFNKVVVTKIATSPTTIPNKVNDWTNSLPPLFQMPSNRLDKDFLNSSNLAFNSFKWAVTIGFILFHTSTNGCSAYSIFFLISSNALSISWV